MDQPEQDASAEPLAAPLVLTYGTHDRSAGPWWRRWLRAWYRAAGPAVVAAVIAAALAYALSPREYTAVTTIDVLPDHLTLLRGTATSPGMDFARADILARSLTRSDRLRAVLTSAQWEAGRLKHPGKTRFDPIAAEALAGTGTVRVRFTDPHPEMARIGADAVVAAITPRPREGVPDPAASAQERLAELVKREQDLRAKIAARDAGKPAPQSAATPSAPRRASTTATAPITRSSAAAVRSPPTQNLELQLKSVSRSIQSAERQLATIPRTHQPAPAQRPRFPSNQKELLATSLYAAAAAFPLVFLVALYGRWRYGGATTVQESDQPIMSAADLTDVLAGTQVRRWRTAAAAAFRPAAALALIAAAGAAWVAPWRYTATVKLTAAQAPATAPATAAPTAAPPGAVTPADAHDAFAAAAMSPVAFDAVVKSPQWLAARAGTNGRPDHAAEVQATGDAQGIVIRFTDTDRDAARYGADAIVPAARSALLASPASEAQRQYMMQVRQYQVLVQSEMLSQQEAAREAAARRARGEAPPVRTPQRGTLTMPTPPVMPRDAFTRVNALREATMPAQLAAAAPATVPWWPSNYAQLGKTAGAAAAQAFVVTFLLALLWFRIRIAMGAPRWSMRRLGVLPWRRALPPALAAALLAALAGYALSPKTYTSTAMLDVSWRTPGGSPAVAPRPPSPDFIELLVAEMNRTVPTAITSADPVTGVVSIRYSGPDAIGARYGAQSAATLAVRWWSRSRVNQLTEGYRAAMESRAGSPQEVAHTLREVQRLQNSAGHEVEIVQPASMVPRADQRVPLTTAAIAAGVTFALVLAGLAVFLASRAHKPLVPPPPLPAAMPVA